MRYLNVHFDGSEPPAGGGTPPADPPAPQFTAEEISALQKAKIPFAELAPGTPLATAVLDTVLKGRKFIERTYDLEKEIKQRERATRTLGAHDLVKDGQLDEAKLNELIERANASEALADLADDLHRAGLISDPGMKLLKAGDPKAAKLALEMMGEAPTPAPGMSPTEIQTAIDAGVQKAVAEIARGTGVNPGLRPAGAGQTPAGGTPPPVEDYGFLPRPNPAVAEFWAAGNPNAKPQGG